MRLGAANIVELAACAERTSTLTGSAVDIGKYEGEAQIILQSSAPIAGTTPTLDVKIQECDTSGGIFTDVSGATFAQVATGADITEMIGVNVSQLKRYIRVVGTIGGTSTPTFQFGVSMVAHRKAGRNASQAV